MQSLWNDADAALCADDLALRAYTSRLLGRDKSLVLHGGGNTSVKGRRTNIFGEQEDILFVKGSGWDLETIEPGGFTPVRMTHLLRLAGLDALSDVQMVNEFRAATVEPSAPAPSVEAILHASLPHKFVDHTHADAVISVTNTPDGEQRIRDLYGDRVIIIPYLMPGFELAQYCARAFAREATPHTVGMVLMAHGIFTWGATARQSYELMIELAGMAGRLVSAHVPRRSSLPPAPPEPLDIAGVAGLRQAVSRAAGAPMLLAHHDGANVGQFINRPDLAALALRGPATPDHVIRTKRVPLIGADAAAVERYVAEYKEYFARNAAPSTGPLAMVDPAPRVLLDAGRGRMFTAGRTAKDCAIAAEIYDHTIDVIVGAEALGGWRALPEERLFQVEYWDLEQAKLTRAAKPAALTGEIALVTGAASGIGKACAEALLARGAAVVGLDLNPAVAGLSRRVEFLGLACDVTDSAAVHHALDLAVRRFGGLDMLVLNAGIFPSSKRIEAMDIGEWQRTSRINVDANVVLLKAAHPLLKQAPRGGRVVVIGSKNVPAPGPGAAAYSASKAALTQLARVAALEWGHEGIRVNVIHPNAVFDTGLWTEEVLRHRAAHYGLTVEQYKTNNVLRVEVTSRDVAEMAAEMCGLLFSRTTGAQVPVDGGNDRVI